MTRFSIALLTVLAAGSAAQAVVVTVPTSGGLSPANPWLGYMNVTDLLGNFQFGTGWGVADINSSFNDAVPSVTLSPNTIGDPNPYWYTPSGGPGSTGNKIMEGNMYIQQDDVHNGTTLTFNGFVTSNTLTSAHVAKIFIRDFAPDYSSFNETAIVATTGAFSISLACDPGAGRHVQYGFQIKGVNVWSTDVAPFGNVVISSVPGPASLGLLGLGGLIVGRRRRA